MFDKCTHKIHQSKLKFISERVLIIKIFNYPSISPGGTSLIVYFMAMYFFEILSNFNFASHFVVIFSLNKERKFC